MKKETVEEVAERFWRNDETMSDYVQQAYITGFIAGSKWQQERMYSIEEVDDLLEMLERSISEINHLKYTYKDKGHCGKYLSNCKTIIEKFKSKIK